MNIPPLLLPLPSITVRHACACAMPALLEALAAKARACKGVHRPYHPFLAVLRVEDDMLFALLERPAGLETYGIYCELPSLHNPLGRRLLGITVAQCTACQANLAQGAPGALVREAGDDQPLCGGCDGRCCEELTIYITHMPGFPLLLREVRGFIYRFFGMHEMADACIPDEFCNAYHVYHYLGNSTAHNNVQPAQRRGPGAPQLYCNVWLFNQMWVLPDPRACSHLRPGWQEIYLEEMGVPPDNWEKSFRAAARYCRLRILRERGEPDSLPAGDQGDGQQDDLYSDEFDDENQDREPPA
jgi:hypothetical protein